MVKLKVISGRFTISNKSVNLGETIELSNEEFEKVKKEGYIGTVLKEIDKKIVEENIVKNETVELTKEEKEAEKFKQLSEKDELTNKEKKLFEKLSKKYGDDLPPQD